MPNADYYGLNSASVNEHASGGVQVIVAEAGKHVVLDYFMVSMATAGTVKFSSSAGGTTDTDLFTVHVPTSGAVTLSNLRIRLTISESLELTSNQTFSALVGYHYE